MLGHDAALTGERSPWPSRAQQPQHMAGKEQACPHAPSPLCPCRLYSSLVAREPFCKHFVGTSEFRSKCLESPGAQPPTRPETEGACLKVRRTQASTLRSLLLLSFQPHLPLSPPLLPFPSCCSAPRFSGLLLSPGQSPRFRLRLTRGTKLQT